MLKTSCRKNCGGIGGTVKVGLIRWLWLGGLEEGRVRVG